MGEARMYLNSWAKSHKPPTTTPCSFVAHNPFFLLSARFVHPISCHIIPIHSIDRFTLQLTLRVYTHTLYRSHHLNRSRRPYIRRHYSITSYEKVLLSSLLNARWIYCFTLCSMRRTHTHTSIRRAFFGGIRIGWHSNAYTPNANFHRLIFVSKRN